VKTPHFSAIPVFSRIHSTNYFTETFCAILLQMEIIHQVHHRLNLAALLLADRRGLLGGCGIVFHD
jgi:hypothetical protein